MTRDLMSETQAANFRKLLMEAKGDRRDKDYAAAANLDVTVFSRLKNGKRPSKEELRRLTSPEANPQNNVTYFDLCEAVGYSVDDSEGLIFKRIKSAILLHLYEAGATLQLEPEKEPKNRSINSNPSYFKINFLVPYDDKSGAWTSWLFISLEKVRPLSFSCKSRVECPDNHISDNQLQALISRSLALLFFLEVTTQTKVSFVTRDSAVFDAMQRRFEKRFPYNGNLTLLEVSEEKISREVVLSKK